MFQATEEYSQGVRSADPVQCDNRIFGGTGSAVAPQHWSGYAATGKYS
jgi:hypothetical protein